MFVAGFTPFRDLNPAVDAKVGSVTFKRLLSGKSNVNKSLTGFTLIELIVVIGIIAILTVIVAPSAFRSIEKSKIARATSDMKSLRAGAISYNVDTGTWPLLGIGDGRRASGMGFMTNNDGNGNTVSGWDGPYLDRWPRNPWGRPGTAFGNNYYWDADSAGDDNGNGIVGEAQVIMFYVPAASALLLDQRYDNGVLTGAGVGNIYQNLAVSSPGDDPLHLNWMVKEPVI